MMRSSSRVAATDEYEPIVPPAWLPPTPPSAPPTGDKPCWLERLRFVDEFRPRPPRRKTPPKLSLLDSLLLWSIHIRLGQTMSYLASEFGVSDASVLDTIATITRVVQLRMQTFGTRLDDDLIDILLGTSSLLRREYWDTTKVNKHIFVISI